MTFGERLYSPSLLFIHRHILNKREGFSILYLAKVHLIMKYSLYCFIAVIHYLGVCVFGTPVNSMEFSRMEQKFTEFSEFGESDKSLQHELESI